MSMCRPITSMAMSMYRHLCTLDMCLCLRAITSAHQLSVSACRHLCNPAMCLCLYAGISAHQKLDLLSELVQLLGYESVTVFGDCFDEVTLLDPVKFPSKLGTQG